MNSNIRRCVGNLCRLNDDKIVGVAIENTKSIIDSESRLSDEEYKLSVNRLATLGFGPENFERHNDDIYESEKPEIIGKIISLNDVDLGVLTVQLNRYWQFWEKHHMLSEDFRLPKTEDELIGYLGAHNRALFITEAAIQEFESRQLSGRKKLSIGRRASKQLQEIFRDVRGMKYRKEMRDDVAFKATLAKEEMEDPEKDRKYRGRTGLPDRTARHWRIFI